MKKSLDHHPHDVFVELSELKFDRSGQQEWNETARWIKYEENAEGANSNRWGKPHVAFLNFHSLFSLRKGLDRGAVLLDLDETDLKGVANRVVEHMVANDQIPAEQKEAVLATLMLKRRHVNENQFAINRRESRIHLDDDGKLITTTTNMTENHSAGNLGQNFRKSFKRNSVFSANSMRRHSSFDNAGLNRSASSGSFRERLFSIKRRDSEVESNINPDTGEGTQVSEVFQNVELMKKLPDNAEATAVLVGAVDFLKTPTIAFVRLAEGIMMDNLVEVPIPVRFLFVLLGPYQGDMDYHEVGRSISTLMSDKHFNEVAYRAHSRGQLLSAINEFLNASIVLPPSEWSNTDLIPVDQIREKAAEMVKRKESLRQKRLQVEPVTPTPDEVKVDITPRATVRHPKEDDNKRDPLIRTRKPFMGAIMDLKERYPRYLSDIIDGLNPQVLATIIFIFFACISPAITFGGLYADKTDRYIGVGETLLATAINGVIVSLFACQPCLIIGATGPLMVFDLALYQFTSSQNIDYLVIRTWIGFGMLFWGIIITAFELVSVVRFLTRFTEEIFSTLVCMIFIIGALEKVYGFFIAHPLYSEYCYEDENKTEMSLLDPTTTIGSIIENVTETITLLLADGDDDDDDDDRKSFNMTSNSSDYNAYENVEGVISNGTLFNGTNADGETVNSANSPQPNTALLSLILTFGTFYIAIKLKHFRNSKYLGRTVRRALGDFGVPIAIVIAVTLDYLIQDTYTDKLTMPEGLSPTRPEDRGWIINPFGSPLEWYIYPAALVAAILLLTLVAIEGSICQIILSKPERHMKKGSGFHFDLLLCCVINCISGVMGAPFMTPAVVRSVSHVSALTVMDTKVAPGESPKVVGAIEQRVSSLVVSVMVGLSILGASLLTLVPNAVLYGVFLYMGVSATAGIQLLERTILYFVPVKHHPTNKPYVKLVKTWKMNLFTGIQLVMLGVLWGIKSSPASLVFPFVLILLIPLRHLVMTRLWTAMELYALDGGNKPEEQQNEELDFFEVSHNIGSTTRPSPE